MSSAIQPSGDTLIPLSEIAAMLTEFFDLDPYIDKEMPSMWWYRSTNNHHISLPMPTPNEIITVGRVKHRMWEQANIVHWYGAWKELEVPVCLEAGDKTNTHGTTVVSKYRRGA